MSDKGWIRLDRDILDNWVWSDKPFSRGQAFVDLILIVNHQNTKLMFNGKFINIKRGQIITSIAKLQDRWGWSRDKVYRFLHDLENDGMIIRDSNNFRTLLTLVNYGLRQDGATTHKTTHKTTNDTTHKTTHKTQTTMKNNDNNENNEEQESKSLTLDEVAKMSWKEDIK